MKDQLIFDVSDAASIAASDSVGAFVRAGTDGTQIGHVADALKVNLSNASIAVTATDLDIRDLTQADEITVFQGTNPWIVSATDLDIRNLTFANDKVDVSGSEVSLDAATLAALENITVSAVDLDIRDISHTQDSIKIGDGVDFLAINADGSINVNADISVTNGSDKAEDAAHANADIGTYVLAVRQDTLANSVSADGDYASLKVDALGALYVNMTNTLSVNDAALANSAIANAAKTLAVADTAEDAVASALANRKYLWLYNKANTKVFIGGAGVTAANGFPISPGSYMELRAGAAVAVKFIGESGKTPEIRSLELA